MAVVVAEREEAVEAEVVPEEAVGSAEELGGVLAEQAVGSAEELGGVLAEQAVGSAEVDLAAVTQRGAVPAALVALGPADLEVPVAERDKAQVALVAEPVD